MFLWLTIMKYMSEDIVVEQWVGGWAAVGGHLWGMRGVHGAVLIGHSAWDDRVGASVWVRVYA